jgi:hypothetical protein
MDHFAKSSDNEIAKLLDSKDVVNTKKATKATLTCLQQYLLNTDQEIN